MSHLEALAAQQTNACSLARELKICHLAPRYDGAPLERISLPGITDTPGFIAQLEEQERGEEQASHVQAALQSIRVCLVPAIRSLRSLRIVRLVHRLVR